MSFICGKCLVPQESGVKPAREVILTRPRTYELGSDEDGDEIPPSKGFEIVKEWDLCPKCVTLSIKEIE